MKRKVISADKHWKGAMWSCRLECGHIENALGTLNDPPRDVECTTCAPKNATELYQELLDRYTQTRCGCGHPACKRCRDDRDTEAVLARARGEDVE